MYRSKLLWQFSHQSLVISISRWAEINAPQTRSGEKLSFPRRRESTAYRRGTKSAINYVHLLTKLYQASKIIATISRLIWAQALRPYRCQITRYCRGECENAPTFNIFPRSQAPAWEREWNLAHPTYQIV